MESYKHTRWLYSMPIIAAVAIAFFFTILMSKEAFADIAMLKYPDKYTTKYDRYFKKYSGRFFSKAFSPDIFKAQAIAESALNPDAVSPVGAIGLMQIMPLTWGDIQKVNNFPGSMRQVQWNIAGGIYYDRWQWNRWKKKKKLSFQTRIALMVGGYNAGYGNILKAYKIAEGGLGGKVVLWSDIVAVSKQVKTWRSSETIAYNRRIFELLLFSRFKLTWI